MIKKIIIISLLTLFTLFTTTALAGDYANIDFIDFKNMVYNVYTNWGTQFTDRKDNLENLLNAHEEEIQPIIDLFNNNPAVWYQTTITYTNNNLTMSYLTNHNQKLYIHNGAIATGSVKSYRFNFSGITGDNPVFSITSYNSYNYGLELKYDSQQYYANSNVYSNANLNSIKIPYATNESFLSGVYTRNFFQWTYNSNLETIYINGYGYVPKLDYRQTGYCVLGELEQYSNLKNIDLKRYVYINNSWTMLDSYMADFLLTKNVSGEIMTLNAQSSTYNISGSIYNINFTPINNSYRYLETYFYLPTRNDIVVNGVLYPNATFSGDNNPTYDDDINHQQTLGEIKDINDTITDDSQVDDLLNDLSGDNLLESIGYSPLENPFTTFILNTMEDITDVLLGSGNVTLDLQICGNHNYLHSEDFVLPNGILKSFITLLSNGFLIWAIGKYGFTLYQWINSGRLQNLVNSTNNHQYYLF